MSQDRNENRRRQQLLKNAGYSVNIDGSWGPYQNKLWMNYLSSGLGPTKQQRINAAKKANQKEAQTSEYYFSQPTSAGNVARGVYHWYNSVPELGGQNESGIQELSAENILGGFTRFNPKNLFNFFKEWKNLGSSIASKRRYVERLADLEDLNSTQALELRQAGRQIFELKNANKALQGKLKKRRQRKGKSSDTGVDWNYWLGFGSFNKPATTTKKVGAWALNAGKVVVPFWATTQTGAYLYDNSVQNDRRARAKAQGKEYIEVPTPIWSASPIGWFQNMHRADVEKGDQYFKGATEPKGLAQPKATTPQEIQDQFWKQYENY